MFSASGLRLCPNDHLVECSGRTCDFLGGTDIRARSNCDKPTEPADHSPAASDSTTETAGATLYVDTENLQDSAQPLVKGVIECWPDAIPPLERLNLYVQADQAQLWEMWAECQFSHLAVTVRGIQHFSKQPSKNAADITIAVDAVADFMSGATQFVAVMSDDSDFMALYAKLRELNQGETPFLWVMTDRDKTRSFTIRDYFPNDHIHVVSFPAKTKTQPKSPARSPKGVQDNAKQLTEMADLIMKCIEVGLFKSTDCQPFIKEHWPDHAMAGMSSPQFGIEFSNKIWPILKERGVKRQETKPRKYEMTEEAKREVDGD